MNETKVNESLSVGMNDGFVWLAIVVIVGIPSKE